MTSAICTDYPKLRPSLFLFPAFLLAGLFFFLYDHHALSAASYIQFQKPYFLLLNEKFGRYPNLMFNLTQLGDALVLLSILSIFIIDTRGTWDALISGSLICLLVSGLLKIIFAVPRPSAALDPHSFIITGNRLCGHNSFPSGHSMTIFTMLTVFVIAYMPKKLTYRILLIFFALLLGSAVALSRIGVGAHYPVDVIAGSIIGYMCGLTGIFISRYHPVCTRITDKRCHGVFLLLLLACCFALYGKIITNNITVFYLALIGILVSLYKIITVHVQKS